MRNGLRDATNGGFVLGSERFQQITKMVGRRTWHGTSGRPRKDLADADQLDLPIQPRNRGLSLVFYVALTWVARTAETKGKT